MAEKLQLILIFVAVICGVVSATYFYTSAGIFMNLLRKPLRLISSGMFLIAIGVLLAAFISYESQLGLELYVGNIPLSAFFYILYIIGSIVIGLGARQFATHPSGNNVVDVSMNRS
ncbi:MAG TPA: hypothetical protein VL335_03540 [Candidatus Paceibacterota bacterium]|jgi:hypothetical protein|nr:hypothetical protein [Candidatus Paceibacterota bacterium]